MSIRSRTVATGSISTSECAMPGLTYPLAGDRPRPCVITLMADGVHGVYAGQGPSVHQRRGVRWAAWGSGRTLGATTVVVARAVLRRLLPTTPDVSAVGATAISVTTSALHLCSCPTSSGQQMIFERHL